MRICILTQPLGHNYGGLLQAYALQTVLKRMGHEVWTEDRRNNNLRFVLRVKKIIREILTFMLGRVSSRFRKVYYPTQRHWDVIRQHTNSFVRQYLTVTDPVLSSDKQLLKRYAFEAYVVGSDQVWRPMYSPCLTNYFLDFTKNDIVKRIAYAASFGTDEWEYTRNQTKKCSRLVQRFDAVSVRETSGVVLCEKYLHIRAVQVLDPTLLLDKEDYINLIGNDISSELKLKGNGVYTYILDESPEKTQIIQIVLNTLNLGSFSVMPQSNFYKVGPESINQCIYAPVSMWIEGFKKAEFVVTDSFHGTVFSILFNKPFVVIANRNRGVDRFVSLLKMVGLENRLLFSPTDLTEELITTPIDFSKVNALIVSERMKSMKFLYEYLKTD